MFVDRVKIYAKAGDGGNGCVSFRREKFIPKGGPDGGNGGWGGSVILRVDPNTNHLIDLLYQSRLIAKRGEHGRGKKQHGKAGADIIAKVPPGTMVRRLPNRELVADLLKPGEELILCQGGRGGRGNSTFKSSTHQAPREFGYGKEGEEGEFEIELKTVADIGIVGYPNAGKSTLIGKLSNAHPKVASYPFTTLTPIIGTVDFKDYQKLQIADIPGLVEGAHKDVGLGHAFLRHIERCRSIIILLDMAGTEGRSPLMDYKNLLFELEQYDPAILEKPRVVVANKMDLPEAKPFLTQFKRKYKLPVIGISADQEIGLEALKAFLHEQIFGSATS